MLEILIRTARKQRKLSQEELSKMTGLSKSSICQYEKVIRFQGIELAYSGKRIEFRYQCSC